MAQKQTLQEELSRRMRVIPWGRFEIRIMNLILFVVVLNFCTTLLILLLK